MDKNLLFSCTKGKFAWTENIIFLYLCLSLASARAGSVHPWLIFFGCT